MENKTKNDFVPIQTKLAGVTFGDCQANIRQWGCPKYGIYDIVREPNNPYDPNAVRVTTLNNDFMGYLPKSIAAELSPMMDLGRTFIAEFVRVNAFSEITDRVGLTVKLIEISE